MGAARAGRGYHHAVPRQLHRGAVGAHDHRARAGSGGLTSDPMWQRFTFDDLRAIGHYLGMLVLFSALLMVVPLVTALVFQEWDPASRYFYSIGIALVVGSGLRFCRIQPGRLNRQQAMAVVGLAWVVLGLFCSIPLYFSGHYATYLDAVFDGVSGLTTTGATLIIDLDHLSYADNMFRTCWAAWGSSWLPCRWASSGSAPVAPSTPLKAAMSTWCPTWCRPRASSAR